MGDLGSSTDSKMSNEATVRVTDRLEQEHTSGFYSGKITMLIGEIRVGHETFRFDSRKACEPLHETEYKVLVPCDSILHIEVDRQFETSDNLRVKHLQLLKFPNNNGTSCSKLHQVDEHHKIEVNISWSPKRRLEQIGEQKFIISPPQPERPVEVKMVSGHLTIVYTIGDAMLFTEFIMTLRSILADHPWREDILDKHNLLNLSSSQKHPVLTKPRSEQPGRWIHIKLQVMHGEEVSWTTLLMRDDDLYVHGFMNQEGVVYELLDNMHSDHMLPNEYMPQRLDWTVQYKSMLEAKGNDQVVEKLEKAKLGCFFARNAVRVLSSYPHQPAYLDAANLALAGLILIICESARMNPIHNAFARGWSTATGFTQELMKDYVWKYVDMSKGLLSWKRRNYNDAPQLLPNSQLRSSQLQAIYLVRNIFPLSGLKAGGLASHPGAGGESGDAGSGGGPARQPGEPRDGASSSGYSSRGNTATADPAGQSSEGSSQLGKDGDSKGPSQHWEADDDDEVQGHGRPRVELLALAMHPDLLVDGMKIVVFDGKRGQIIYRRNEQQADEKEQGQEIMEKLVLAGPYRGISAEYGCFAIKIDIPGMPSSGSGNKHHSIKWEWDCDDPTYAAQVDTPRPAHHTIKAQDGSKVAEVDYAVMSNAREATVQVKFRLKAGHNAAGIGGEISALIDGFEDKYRSVLFRCAKGTPRYFSRTDDDDSWFLLELARNVVAVACDRRLHIEVDLQIESEDGKEVEVKVPLSFENGICSSKTDDDKHVEVAVNWYPEVKTVSDILLTLLQMRQTDLVYTIGDEFSFISFMMDLRRKLADHPGHQDILDGHPVPNISSTREHPLLSERLTGSDQPPARWIHIKLEVAAAGRETTTMTLIFRGDDLYVCGFMNQKGDCFQLSDGTPDITTRYRLPQHYNARLLDWGLSYNYRILDGNSQNEVFKKLESAKLGKAFAEEAVAVLSSFPDLVVVPGITKTMSPETALVGLSVMVCDSARINPLHDAVAHGWNDGTVLTRQLSRYIANWFEISKELLRWKARGYGRWSWWQDESMELRGAKSALDVVHLVLNV